MRFAVVSPHLDDAAFSLGETIADWVDEGHEVTIFSVYAGIPKDPDGRAKYQRLWLEHERCCEVLGAAHHNMDFLDDTYCPRPPVTAVTGAIRDAVAGFNVVVGPTGIHHPDHQRVAAVCADLGTWRYDELPYYVEFPLQAFRGAGEYAMITPPPGHLPIKRRACLAYESQIHEKEERCLWVPERLWRPVEPTSDAGAHPPTDGPTTT